MNGLEEDCLGMTERMAKACLSKRMAFHDGQDCEGK